MIVHRRGHFHHTRRRKGEARFFPSALRSGFSRHPRALPLDDCTSEARPGGRSGDSNDSRGCRDFRASRRSPIDDRSASDHPSRVLQRGRSSWSSCGGWRLFVSRKLWRRKNQPRPRWRRAKRSQHGSEEKKRQSPQKESRQKAQAQSRQKNDAQKGASQNNATPVKANAQPQRGRAVTPFGATFGPQIKS